VYVAPNGGLLVLLLGNAKNCQGQAEASILQVFPCRHSRSGFVRSPSLAVAALRSSQLLASSEMQASIFQEPKLWRHRQFALAHKRG
jgi:hypothetical protein